MNNPPDHLIAKAQEALALPPVERIKWFASDHWVGYPKALKLFERMEYLRAHEKVERVPNLLIIGDSNNGKSSILTRFEKSNPPKKTPEGLRFPVVRVVVPGPDPLWLFNRILEVFGIPHNPNDHIRKREPQVHRLLIQLGVELLMVDELNAMIAGHPTKQQQFLIALRTIGTTLKIPIVATGTKEAARGIAVDSQMMNRFPSEYLPRWEPDREWQSLVVSFERLIPLSERSNLGVAEMASKLHALSEGLIGELKTVLIECLTLAVHQGKNRIDKDIINSLTYVPPSKRSHPQARRVE